MLGWASLVERNAFALRRFDVPVLPAGAPPLRVLHLSDLHLLPRQRAKQAWVRSLASLDPDLVINTGDNLAHATPCRRRSTRTSRSSASPGVFVLGSNDYFAPTPKNPLRYLLRNHAKRVRHDARLPTADLVARTRVDGGWIDLTNRRDALTVRGVRLDFVGVDDPHLGYDRLDLVARAGRTRRRPDDRRDARALPAGARRVCRRRRDLIIAGHTHGGQVCVPGYGALVTNCDLDTGRVKGAVALVAGSRRDASSHAPEDAAWLEVSAGLGTSPTAPVRLACRPEATLLTLVPARA